ncbi:unnamed protein product [Owenia fusiformis]|uniref:Uncharacterized protein n=1 Tax=Owenia fusiformis TaxID=6347 RepID=A0A8S4PR78_OWEFU|nr:unnamed protein product [Owenia fusiformis]
MNLMTVALAFILSVLTVYAAKSCDNDDDCKPGSKCNDATGLCAKPCDNDEDCKRAFNCNNATGFCARPCDNDGECKLGFYCPKTNFCEKQVFPGDICETNRHCKGASTCENTTDSAPEVKVCTERCRTDVDCEQYGKKSGKGKPGKGKPKLKYCTTGGLASLEKGYCVPTKEEGEDCNRSPECEGKLFCKHGTCLEAAEAVTCELDCNGPREKNPKHIKPGETVNVTYSCTFVRRGEFGPLPIKASLLLNKKTKIGQAQGESPVTISGSRLMNDTRTGEFSAEIHGIMKRCRNHRKICRASRRCILKA